MPGHAGPQALGSILWGVGFLIVCLGHSGYAWGRSIHAGSQRMNAPHLGYHSWLKGQGSCGHRSLHTEHACGKKLIGSAVRVQGYQVAVFALLRGQHRGMLVHERFTSSTCFCTMLDITCDEMLNLERSTAVGMRPRTAARTVQKAVQICGHSRDD